MTVEPTEGDATWVDLTGAIPPTRVRAARFRQVGRTLAQMIAGASAPIPDSGLSTTRNVEFALIDAIAQVVVLLDCRQIPTAHWHLSISGVSGDHRRGCVEVSVEEITAWVLAGFPTAAGFRTYTLATGTTRYAEITLPATSNPTD